MSVIGLSLIAWHSCGAVRPYRSDLLCPLVSCDSMETIIRKRDHFSKTFIQSHFILLLPKFFQKIFGSNLTVKSLFLIAFTLFIFPSSLHSVRVTRTVILRMDFRLLLLPRKCTSKNKTHAIVWWTIVKLINPGFGITL